MNELTNDLGDDLDNKEENVCQNNQIYVKIYSQENIIRVYSVFSPTNEKGYFIRHKFLTQVGTTIFSSENPPILANCDSQKRLSGGSTLIPLDINAEMGAVLVVFDIIPFYG